MPSTVTHAHRCVYAAQFMSPSVTHCIRSFALGARSAAGADVAEARVGLRDPLHVHRVSNRASP